MAKTNGIKKFLSYYEKKLNGKYDRILLDVVLILVCFGLIMCFSASAPNARAFQGDSYYFLRKQAFWGALGIFVMLFATHFNYKGYKEYSRILYFATVIMLCIVLAMPEVKGARRWIGLGFASFQPSEVAKLSLIITYAKLLEKEEWKKKKTFGRFLGYLIIFGVFAALLMLEPHFSCTLLIFAIAMTMLFVSNAKLKDFVISGIFALPLIGVVAVKKAYRLKRLTTFFGKGTEDITGSAWQITQSLYAIGSGGLFGLGLGKSRQKYLYLPEPQNDFIFAIICEELGFIGATIVLILFGILIWRGVVIAVNSKDKFATLLATGITALIAIQVLVNIAVVTSTMPVTGMPLPFFSAGGSSLVFIMLEMGILLNISTHLDDE